MGQKEHSIGADIVGDAQADVITEEERLCQQH